MAEARSSRSVVIVMLLVAVTLLLYAIGQSDDGDDYSPTSTKARGTAAMVDLLGRNGVDVDIIRGAPTSAGGVALVLDDKFRTPSVDADSEFEDEIANIFEWVEAGGTLVVADPASSLLTTPVVGAYRTGLACDIAALSAVQELGLESDDGDGFGAIEAVSFAASGDKPRCFYDEPGRAAIVVDDLGDGVIVAFGLRELLTNRRIGDADHARLAVSLLAPQPGQTVQVIDGPSLLVNGEETLSDLVPTSVKWGLGVGAFAFALYALGRSRRHGNPVLEPLSVQISGSELVEATGAMLGRARQASGAGEALRLVARQDLAVALNLPRATEGPVVAATLADRFGPVDAADAQRILNGSPIVDDDQLLSLANDINRLRHMALGPPESERISPGPAEPNDHPETLNV